MRNMLSDRVKAKSRISYHRQWACPLLCLHCIQHCLYFGLPISLWFEEVLGECEVPLVPRPLVSNSACLLQPTHLLGGIIREHYILAPPPPTPLLLPQS